MTWTHIDEAPTPKRTLQRRVQRGEVANILCPATGRRLVWVAPGVEEPSRADILEELRALRSEVGELREQLRTRPAEVSTIDPLPVRRLERLSGPSSKAPRASEPTPDQSAALELLRRAVELYGSVTAASRELGFNHGQVSAWLRGRKSPSSPSCSRILARAEELGLMRTGREAA